MKGIIMAGGAGSRLRPLTCDLPKPMVPVMNKPVMTYSIELLKKYGITDIGVTLQYLPEQIQDFFQDGSDYGVHLSYFIEESPLGTAGSVKNAGGFLDEPFVVISGDALTDIDLGRAIQFHKEKGSIATLVLKRVKVPLEFGVVITDESDSVTRFLEKPNWGEVFSDTVNTGIYIMDPKALNFFDAGKKFDFSCDLFPLLLKNRQRMYGYITNEYWCDIGDCQTYLSAHYDMLNGRVHQHFDGQKTNDNIWLGKGLKIAKGAKLEGPCLIGDYCSIEKDAYIGPYSVIGENCHIGEGASVKRSILWNHIVLGDGTAVRGAAICSKVGTGRRVSLYEGAVIGDGCQLKEGSSVKPQVRIWPGKTIEEGNIVQSNVVWGTRANRTLFGKDGIHGSVNTEWSPYATAKLGAAFGAFLCPKKKIAVSCGNHPVSGMLKYSLVSGLLSAGLEVFDLGQLTKPVLRYSVRHLALDAGIHLFAAPEDPGDVRFCFTDSHGCNLLPSAERKIESLYIRDDFQRPDPESIKRVHILSDVPVFYMRSLMDSVDAEKIRERNYKILVFANGNRLGNNILYRVLKESGCHIQSCFNNPEQERKQGDFDLGCQMSTDCEAITLFDEMGNSVDPEIQRAIVSLIYLRDKPDGKIAVPCTSPGIFDQLAEQYSCTVVRTKSSKQALMAEIYGTPLFPLYFDGTAVLLKLLEWMAREDVTLSQLVREIPEFHVREKEIPCPWAQKGTVMRTLMEEEGKGDQSVEMFEGIRINHEKGWALILPDSEEPVCRVFTEGVSEEYAEELAGFYEEKVKKIQSRERGSV